MRKAEEQQLELSLQEPEPPKPVIVFDETDIGHYADEANGEKHRQNVLARLLRYCGEDKLADELDKLSSEEGEDFAYETEDAALEALSEHSAEGLYWEIDGGLFLRKNEDEEQENEEV